MQRRMLHALKFPLDGPLSTFRKSFAASRRCTKTIQDKQKQQSPHEAGFAGCSTDSHNHLETCIWCGLRSRIAARKKGVFSSQYAGSLEGPTFSTQSAKSGRQRYTPIDTAPQYISVLHTINWATINPNAAPRNAKLAISHGQLAFTRYLNSQTDTAASAFSPSRYSGCRACGTFAATS